jgi:hypothetical protein
MRLILAFSDRPDRRSPRHCAALDAGRDPADPVAPVKRNAARSPERAMQSVMHTPLPAAAHRARGADGAAR